MLSLLVNFGFSLTNSSKICGGHFATDKIGEGDLKFYDLVGINIMFWPGAILVGFLCLFCLFVLIGVLIERHTNNLETIKAVNK